VLDGDAALFQYLPSVMGIAYPTGFPVYILLGRLWQTFVPIGATAWRMNAFSAACGALSLVLVCRAYTYWLDSRLGGIVTAVLFGTLPTFWRWSTESKSYTLHILFLLDAVAESGCIGIGQCSIRTGNHHGIRLPETQRMSEDPGGCTDSQRPIPRVDENGKRT